MNLGFNCVSISSSALACTSALSDSGTCGGDGFLEAQTHLRFGLFLAITDAPAHCRKTPRPGSGRALTLPSPVAPQIDPPCRPDELRDHTEACPAVCLLEYVEALRRIRTEAARVRGDADPTKIEAVGVPAGLDRDVGMSPLVSVPGTGTVQEPELVIR